MCEDVSVGCSAIFYSLKKKNRTLHVTVLEYHKLSLHEAGKKRSVQCYNAAIRSEYVLVVEAV